MPLVLLGNPAALYQGQTLPGDRITVAQIPDEYTPSEQILVITAVSIDGSVDRGVWVAQSSAPAPDWVESNSPALAQALADHYGCPAGRPEGWVESYS